MRKFLYFSKNTKPAFGDMAKSTIMHYLVSTIYQKNPQRESIALHVDKLMYN